MDKILLEIACPATSKRYDFWVSKKMRISSVKEKMMSEIREFEKNELIFRNESLVMLFRENGDTIKNENVTIEQAGICSGDCLMLI